MGYTLYTDKDTKFECKIELQGASLKGAEARIIVESGDLMLMFKGPISKNGKCVIPIKKMGRIMDESASGEMRLEIIAEDAYFQPWKSAFTVTASRKLTVEVMSPSGAKRKPTAIVRLVNDPMSKLTRGIIRELKIKGVNTHNIHKKRSTVVKCINEHVKKSRMDVKPASLIRTVVKHMAN